MLPRALRYYIFAPLSIAILGLLLARSTSRITVARQSQWIPSLILNWKSTLNMSSSSSSSEAPVIVVGGGLAGLSAALTVLENSGKVILIDKKPSLGGNSVKASSGINGAGTESQKNLNISDTVQAFYEDTIKSAGPTLARPDLITALTSNSAGAIEWLTQTMNVDLSLVSLLGGHSIPRTHRGKGGAPGWAMVSTLVKKLTAEEEKDSSRAKIIKGSKVVKLLQDGEGKKVEGVVYETTEGEKVELKGSVIISTGGFGADFSPSGFIATHRPELISVPTTNGDHATGDGHRLVTSLASHPGILIDMDQIQVHPTGFVDPAQPDAKTKFLAAEALRGVGGLLITKDGERFVNEVEKRDYVTEKMSEVIKQGKGPVRLVLGVKAAEELKAHCDFYVSKGLMKKYANINELAQDMNIAVENIRKTFDAHKRYASGEEADPYGKGQFHNTDINPDEPLLVALMTPVVHYTMGGIQVDARARVVDASGAPITGLYAAGEAIGGVHGKNRLGGSSLLEAVVFGRIAGGEAVKGL